MKLNQIADNIGAKRSRKRVGRGIGSGTGKTSGRGQKGQKSRSGVSLLGFEGGQMPLYRRLPKRGFFNQFSKKFSIITLGRIQVAIDTGRLDSKGIITNDMIIEAGLVRKGNAGVKLLATGSITSKLKLDVTAASTKAIEAITKAGGSVSVVEKRERVPGKGKRRDRISALRKEKYAQTIAELDKSKH